MLATSIRSLGRSVVLNNPRLPVGEARDRVQHHIIAALAQIDDPRLVFKGGTMLRVCGLPNYRYSEDLDFDWIGTPSAFHNTLSDALDEAAWSSGAELELSVGRGPNPEVVWRDEGHHDNMSAEATFLSEHYVPLRTWQIRPNHPDIPPSPPILGYELVSVMADKLSAVSRRVAPRDVYDLNSLLWAGVDMHAGWALYVAHHQHPEIQYGWRPHPSDIRASYLGRRGEFANGWEYLVRTGWLPAVPFHEAFSNVDNAIRATLNQWKQGLAPGELHRLKQEHQRQRRSGKGFDLGL